MTRSSSLSSVMGGGSTRSLLAKMDDSGILRTSNMSDSQRSLQMTSSLHAAMDKPCLGTAPHENAVDDLVLSMIGSLGAGASSVLPGKANDGTKGCFVLKFPLLDSIRDILLASTLVSTDLRDSLRYNLRNGVSIRELPTGNLALLGALEDTLSCR